MTLRTFRDAYLLVQDVPTQYPHHHSHTHPHLQSYRHAHTTHSQQPANQQHSRLPVERLNPSHQQQARHSSKNSFVNAAVSYPSTVRPSYPLYPSYSHSQSNSHSYASTQPQSEHSSVSVSSSDGHHRSTHSTHEVATSRPAHEIAATRPSLPMPPHSRMTHKFEHPLLPQAFPRSPYRPVTVAPVFIGSMTKAVFVKVCAALLDSRSHANTKYSNLPSHTQPESVFFSVSKPDISTEEYILRLVSYTQCSPSAFVVMLIYLDRIAAANGRLKITWYNLHRLLITALMLACKMVDDHCFSTVHYAKVGGIPTAREMNRLEIQFLQFVKYRMHVPVDVYFTKQHDLDSSVVGVV